MKYKATKMLSAIVEVNNKQYNLEPNNICHIGSQRPELPNDILIEQESIKDTHATITVFNGNWFLISRTGKNTYVNGIEITRCPVKLNDNDAIKFGEVEAQFRLKDLTQTTNESSGYEDVISSSPELLRKRHLIFKGNEIKDTQNISDISCEDSFMINNTLNNLTINKENDETCFIPETQELQSYAATKTKEDFGEEINEGNCDFRIDTQEFSGFGENVDIDEEINEELSSLVIPHIQHPTVMLFGDKSADISLLNSVQKNLTDVPKNNDVNKDDVTIFIQHGLNKSAEIKDKEMDSIAIHNIDVREGSCTPDLFDNICTREIVSIKKSEKPTNTSKKDNTNLAQTVNNSNLLATQKFISVTFDENSLPSNISQKENKEPNKKLAVEYPTLEATQIFMEPNLDISQNINLSHLETPQFLKMKYIKPKETDKSKILSKPETKNNNLDDINHDEWLEQVNRPRKSTEFLELFPTETSTAAKQTSNKELKRNSNDSLESSCKKRKTNESLNLKKHSPSTHSSASKQINKKGKLLNCKVKVKKTVISTRDNATDVHTKTVNDSKADNKNNTLNIAASKQKKRLISQEETNTFAAFKSQVEQMNNENVDARNYKTRDVKKRNTTMEATVQSSSKATEEEILNVSRNDKKVTPSNKKQRTNSEPNKSSVNEKKSRRSTNDAKSVGTHLISKEETNVTAISKSELMKRNNEHSYAKNYKSQDLKKNKASTETSDQNTKKSKEEEILYNSKNDKNISHSTKKKRTTSEANESLVFEKKSKRAANDSKSDEIKQKLVNMSTPLIEKRKSTRLLSHIETNEVSSKKVKTVLPEKHAVKKEIASEPISEEISSSNKARHNVSKSKDLQKSNPKSTKVLSGSNETKTQAIKNIVHDEQNVRPRRTTRLMSQNISIKSTQNQEDVRKKSKMIERDASKPKDNKEESKEHKKEKPPILVSFSTIDTNEIQYLKHKSNNLWDEAEHAKNCDVLIMNKASRTIKFLIAIARGIPIVTLDWLSKKSANSKELSNCMLNDKEFEKKYNFKLVNALSKSHKAKLFKGFEFSMTENISPGVKDMQDLLNCTEATVHTKISSLLKSTKKRGKELYLISSEKDKSIWEEYTKTDSRLQVISTEGVMLAVMHQDVIYLDTHKLK